MWDPTPGEILRTKYGIVVVLKKLIPEDGNSTATFNKEERMFKARLWREPGKSIGSSATAFLCVDTIIERMPAAPGMVTVTKDDMDTELLIHCYSESRNIYLASSVFDNDAKDPTDDQHYTIQSKLSMETTSSSVESLIDIKPNDLVVARSAKFYPFIDELIVRGNQAITSANSIMKENDLHQLNISSELPSDSVRDGVSGLKDGVKDYVQNLAGNEETVEIYNMLKDEELNVLLKKGQERLQALTSNKNLTNKEETSSSVESSIIQEQQKALGALDSLLEENADINIQTIQETMGNTFRTMIDSLSSAAEHDETLNAIVQDINEKTSEWQELTGRLMETRSSSVFFEGVNRLNSRVEKLLGPEHLQFQNAGVTLTKAFTEGDVALAKLKTVELGDSIRSRLFTAIEVRSDSSNGLDGIIAGALGAIDSSGTSEDGIVPLINNLQKSVSSSVSSENESLISILSDGSKHKDTAIMGIERALLELEDYIDEDLDAEQIANMATNTSALFQPIAKKASKEIEKQLDNAEESITDPTMLACLSNVRRIVSGELTMASLTDEIVEALNDDSFVKAGENIVQKGEELLDAIENASDNSGVGTMIQAAEKAGLTKDAVLGTLENLNVDDMLDTAGDALTDEAKRRKLFSSATDSALEFLLKILPSMPVPPFEGVKEGLLYSVKNLSMHGFKMRKEDIFIEIAGIKAAEQAPLHNEANQTFKSTMKRDVKATELLIIDVRNISAVFDKAAWDFEQTNLPYLKGQGLANVQCFGGHITLQFELRKSKKINDRSKVVSYEPVLCLHKKECAIREVELSFEGESRLTWFANKAAKWMKKPLRDYVVSSVLNIMTNKSGWLLENLNTNLGSYWDLILKTAGLTGAAIVFCQPKSENDGSGRRVVPPGMMAFSLALAGSVMVTVSVISIIPEVLMDTSIDEDEPYKMIPIWSMDMFYRILFFIIGCTLYFLLSWCFHIPDAEDLLHAENFNVMLGEKQHPTDGVGSNTTTANTATTSSSSSDSFSDMEYGRSSTLADKDSNHANEHVQPLLTSSPSIKKRSDDQQIRSRIHKSNSFNNVAQDSNTITHSNSNEKRMKTEEEVSDSSDSSSGGGIQSWTSGKDLKNKEQQKAWRLAVLLFVSLLVHNFPEGLAVAASALESPKLGLTVTVGIMVHNIPEGIAIAIPCLVARPDQPWLSFALASISGLAEPLGAFVALLFLRDIEKTTPDGDDDVVSKGQDHDAFLNLENILSFVAGIMIMVAVLELFPEATRHVTVATKHLYYYGIVSGFLLMLVTELYLP